MNFIHIPLLLFSLTFYACESTSDSSNSSTKATSTTSKKFTLTSTSFVNQGTLDNRFTYVLSNQCNGHNDFPQLSWTDPPTDTRSFVLIVQDPDGQDWVHLNLYDIPASESSIAQLTASGSPLRVTFPAGMTGNNSWSIPGLGWTLPALGNS